LIHGIFLFVLLLFQSIPELWANLFASEKFKLELEKMKAEWTRVRDASADLIFRAANSSLGPMRARTLLLLAILLPEPQEMDNARWDRQRRS
jgi:hypothetical protein